MLKRACPCLIVVLLLLSVSVPARANQSKPVSEENTILVMGDSLSAAYRLPVEFGWVAMLENQLIEEGYPVSLKNVSVSGATTAAGLKILPSAIEEHQPEFVVLALGANDGLQGKPLPYIRSNLAKLIQISKNSNAKVLLLGVRIPPNYGSAYAEPFFSQYRELSEEHQIQLVPFFLDGAAGKTELMMDDGKHPNAEGQKIVLQNVLPSVKALLSKN